MMKLIRFVHEGGLVAYTATESQSIRDRFGLLPVLVTEAREDGRNLDNLLSRDGRLLELRASSLSIFNAPDNFPLFLKINSLAYDLNATVYHCKQLASAYADVTSAHARIRSNPGYPDQPGGWVSFCDQAVPYYELDALLSAARRVYDKTAHMAWQAFGGKGGGMPGNAADLLKRRSNMPPKTRDRLRSSWDTIGAKLKDYRDCTQHFASTDIGLCTINMIRLDKDVWKARALIPDNPEVKSKKKFSYASTIDALAYGWQVTDEVVALAVEMASAIPKPAG
jgi:hypothetical protein